MRLECNEERDIKRAAPHPLVEPRTFLSRSLCERHRYMDIGMWVGRECDEVAHIKDVCWCRQMRAGSAGWVEMCGVHCWFSSVTWNFYMIPLQLCFTVLAQCVSPLQYTTAHL